jgi:hypothetical protein
VIVDSLSVTVQLTETSLVYQLLLPSVPLTFGVITGGVVSQMRVTEAVAAPEEFPAASVETALMVFGPQESGTASLEKVPVAGTNVAAEPLTATPATPLLASAAVPVTSMVAPDVDAGSASSVADGIVPSRLIVTEMGPAEPPKLVAEHE